MMKPMMIIQMMPMMPMVVSPSIDGRAPLTAHGRGDASTACKARAPRRDCSAHEAPTRRPVDCLWRCAPRRPTRTRRPTGAAPRAARGRCRWSSCTRRRAAAAARPPIAGSRRRSAPGATTACRGARVPRRLLGPAGLARPLRAGGVVRRGSSRSRKRRAAASSTRRR